MDRRRATKAPSPQRAWSVSDRAAERARRPGRSRGMTLAARESGTALGLMSFNSIGFAIFTLIPAAFSIYMAFFDWPLTGGQVRFVGFQNFRDAVTSFDFWRVVLNVLYFVAGYVPLNLIVSIGLATLLGPRNSFIKCKQILRVLFFIPVVTPAVASALVWSLLYGQNGIFNTVLTTLHLPAIGWLTSTNWAMPSIIIMSLWLGFGYNMILFIAGMTNIPSTLYDAAAIDGAGPLRQLFSVTLPMLSPVIFFGTLLTLITSFQVFDQAYILTGGGPGNASTTLVLEIYDEAFKYFRLGYGSAIAILLAVLILIVTGLFFLLQRRWVYYEQ